ncbi:hypothetical protein QMK61_11185 [Fulvimonas sp. R45]|uniref:hypothetical protein n=1 Tax=Fulvimonas sp. R45 TaxID=3045937 RepID=UPI00265E1335|nr:hypothetical protein [Fulvimonas sp. R45]MDO1529392.1 hypothetical protein [Fulvimonas sp. R45]
MVRFPGFASSLRLRVAVGVLLLAVVAAVALWRMRRATPPLDSGVAILLRLADQARREHHLLAPVGSNVYEFYFSVLQLDPANRTALDGLHEAFEPACAEVERAIITGDLDEAQRELRLLRAYDAGNYRYLATGDDSGAGNYKLALLGGYLDAQRSLLSHRHAMEAELRQARGEAKALP